MTPTKTEIIRIIITALVSTLIAVLQAYLVHLTGGPVPAADPMIAGAFGGVLAATKKV